MHRLIHGGIIVTRLLAILFGIAFIFVGVAGFIPTFTPDGLLFGYFTSVPMHNIVHILTGVIAIMCATSYSLARVYFQIFGLLYMAAAIWGFWNNGDLYMMHLTLADNILHVVIGLIALLVGFGKRQED